MFGFPFVIACYEGDGGSGWFVDKWLLRLVHVVRNAFWALIIQGTIAIEVTGV